MKADIAREAVGPDHYQRVYEAVRGMLKAGESDESVDDAVFAAFVDHENSLDTNVSRKALTELPKTKKGQGSV